MKNTLNVLSVRVFGIIAFMAVFTLSAATCSGQSGGSGKTLNSPEALKEYLDSQPANSPDKPIKVSMGVNAPMLPKIKDVLNSAGKYVNLNITGNALTNIPEYAFLDIKADKGCETLVGITIPGSVTSIGRYAFAGSGLTSVTFGNGITSIGEVAFFRCVNLVSITIPNSVTSIKKATFSGCNSLASVTIPNSVTSIESEAFTHCLKLTSVTFQGNINKNNFVDDYGNSYGDGDDFSRPFHGDLIEKYLAGGIGTYTTTTPVPANIFDWNPVWTKK